MTRKCLLPFVLLVLTCRADWPQFLGPNRNGTSHDTNIASSWPKDGPPVRWQRQVGEGFSGPIMASGKLILFHRLNNKETVECLEAGTGKSIWISEYPTQYKDSFGFDEGPRATPAINDGKVFTFGAEGVLNCWNLNDGQKIWSVDTQKEFGASKGFFGMACSPLVEGDLAIVNIGGRNRAGVVAFDKNSGRVAWKVSDDEASYSSPTAATINGKRYAFVLSRSRLTALEPKTGAISFEFPWRPEIDASVSAATPLVIDDLVFISASYGLGAAVLRITDSGPQKVWSGDEILSNHYATSVHHNGFLYGFDGRQEYGCNLRCIELKTGRIRWSEDRFGAGTLMLAGHELLILTDKGELVRAPAIPDRFKPAQRAQILPSNVRAYPALAEGRFYARSKDRLICVDLR